MTSVAESKTGVKTKSAAKRSRSVLIDQVKTDVRRVVGREYISSHKMSWLLLEDCGVVRTMCGA